MNTKILIICAIFALTSAEESFQDCLQKDSISCIQLSVRDFVNFYIEKGTFESDKIVKKIGKS